MPDEKQIQTVPALSGHSHSEALPFENMSLLLKDVKMKADFFETKSEFKFPTAVTVVLPGKYRAR